MTPRKVVDWLFVSRDTGEITIAQVPNAPLAVFLVAFAVRAVARPHGGVLTAFDVVTAVSLTVWALIEITRGVNPFRRILGAAVFVAELVALIGH